MSNRIPISITKSFQATSKNGKVFGAVKEIYGDRYQQEAIAVLQEVWKPIAVAYSTGDLEQTKTAIMAARCCFERNVNTALQMLTSIDQLLAVSPEKVSAQNNGAASVEPIDVSQEFDLNE